MLKSLYARIHRAVPRRSRSSGSLPHPSLEERAMRSIMSRRRVGADPSRTLAAGDSGNDAPMFDSKKRSGIRGIVVGNAKPELVSWAKAHDQNEGAGHVFFKKYAAAAIVDALTRLKFFT